LHAIVQSAALNGFIFHVWVLLKNQNLIMVIAGTAQTALKNINDLVLSFY